MDGKACHYHCEDKVAIAMKCRPIHSLDCQTLLISVSTKWFHLYFCIFFKMHLKKKCVLNLDYTVDLHLH